MKVVAGLLTASKPRKPMPPASPEDFRWPNQRDADEDVARKIAASLQELLPAKGMKHTDLAKVLWGTKGANDGPRNIGSARRWVLGELPIPNEAAAGHIAELLEVPMARLLKPEIKFNPKPEMIRPRSPNGVNLWKTKGRKAMKAKSAKGAKKADDKAHERKLAYQRAWRLQKKKEKAAAGRTNPTRKYTRAPIIERDMPKGNGSWVLAAGVDPPEYTIKSEDAPSGHVRFELNAVLPHERAMAILHMLQHGETPKE